MATTATNLQATRSQAARDRICQAALTVFALKGYASASMDDIGLAAGLSKGGLYHHFPAKNAVLLCVVDRLAAIGALYPPFEAAGGSTLTPEALGRVLIEIWAEATHDEALRAHLRSRYEAHLDATINDNASAITAILRLGALIQLLTHADVDADAAARRLGLAA